MSKRKTKKKKETDKKQEKTDMATKENDEQDRSPEKRQKLNGSGEFIAKIASRMVSEDVAIKALQMAIKLLKQTMLGLKPGCIPEDETDEPTGFLEVCNGLMKEFLEGDEMKKFIEINAAVSLVKMSYQLIEESEKNTLMELMTGIVAFVKSQDQK